MAAKATPLASTEAMLQAQRRRRSPGPSGLNGEAQLINYLKGTGYRVGLLLNFGTPSLQHTRRVV